MDAVLPHDLDEALDALATWPDAHLLAGGTDLMVEVNFGRLRPERIVSLRRIRELASSRKGWIGAGETWRALESSPHQALAQLSRTIGSPQIRNAATIGGNLGTASPAADGLPFLAACDATVELASHQGTRRLRWDEFLTGVKRTARRPGELITGVHLPDDVPQRQAFAKIGIRQAMAIGTVSCVVMRGDDGDTRVALGSVAPTAIRARRAEEMISGEARPSEAALAEFARIVSEEVRPITDHRSTAEYRRHAAGMLAGRCLRRVLSPA